jgi:voltage-gated potassium channel
MFRLAKKYNPIRKQYLNIILLVILFFVYSTINYALGRKNLLYHRHDDISYLDAMYFTTVTITSIGYGDITPNTKSAKVVCMLQIMSFWAFIYNFF